MAARLRDLQSRLAAAILGGDLDGAAALIRADRLPAAERLRVYRNHSFTSLAEALAANFPVTARLVGEDFFRAAAKRFVAAEPPSQPCLSAYGEAFPDFLASFGPAQSLPYLADVARLEYLRIEVVHAPEEPALDLVALADLPETAQRNLPLALLPGVRLLASPFPVDRIWLAHQEADVAPVDLAGDPCRLLVRAAQGAARFERIDAGTHAFLDAAANGATLESAAEAALAADPGFDLARALATHRAIGIFADTIGPRR
jgi:hypothetical protein